jgi:hypothetical protein
MNRRSIRVIKRNKKPEVARIVAVVDAVRVERTDRRETTSIVNDWISQFQNGRIERGFSDGKILTSFLAQSNPSPPIKD